MPLLINNPKWEARLLERRRLAGADLYDEVWDGVYIMSPLADDKHQKLVTRIAYILEGVIGVPGLGEVRAGMNVSDRARGWKHNYRIPDLAVRLNDGRARIMKKHWFGGPDFVVEVVSQGDRSREKLDFYAAIGTREVLILDRNPWSLELYSLRDGRLIPSGVCREAAPVALSSEVLPLSFKLVPGKGSPEVEVVHTADGQSWRI